LSSIAAEILPFYCHPAVKEYIDNIHSEYKYKERGYKKKIRFYSGLESLGKICEEKYIIKKDRELPCDRLPRKKSN